MSSPDTTWQSPETMPVGTIVAGRYRLERLLGKGGFGAVFLALNSNDGSRVALKVLSRSVLDMVGGDARFRREADLARRLRHPNVVRVLDTGVDAAGALYIAFELLEGRSVQDEIVDRGPMAPERAARLVIEVLRALEEAHALGIIHRDLKPANIFILGHDAAPPPGSADRVKVLDFGIAKSTNPGTLAGLTQQGTTLGTPTYMAPEQMTGGELTPAADLFAMGVVLTELCLGRPLYGKDASALELFRERLMGQPIPVPDDLAQSPIGAVIQKATATQAEHRYRSAAEMREALEAVLPRLASGPPVPATHVPSTAGHPYAGPPTVAGQSPAAWSGAAPMPMPAPMPSAPPPWSPPLAPPGAGMHTPMAQATSGPYVTPSRGGSGMIPIAIVIGVFVLGVAVVGAFLFLGGSDDRVADKDKTSQRKSADRDRQADEDEEDEESDGEDEEDEEPVEADDEESDADEGDPEGQGAAVEVEPAHEVRVLECSAVATLQKPALSSHLSAIGWRVTGDLTYCPGSMINFRCVGGDGRGVTAENDGESGQVAIIRFSTASEARAYVDGEKTKREDVTLAQSGAVVLRVELPAADADRLLGRFCSA